MSDHWVSIFLLLKTIFFEDKSLAHAGLLCYHSNVAIKHVCAMNVGASKAGEREAYGSINQMEEKNMSVISMKQLLEAGVHFGHQTRRWKPKMSE